MSKIAEQKALELYPPENGTLYQRLGYVKGYDQALSDIKQYVQKLINHEEKEWGKHNVDFGLYTILGHIVKIEENE